MSENASPFSSVSVVGGWQTKVETAVGSYMIGPVFNSTIDLWQWQRDNIKKNN